MAAAALQVIQVREVTGPVLQVILLVEVVDMDLLRVNKP
jgi:hypothetical protein